MRRLIKDRNFLQPSCECHRNNGRQLDDVVCGNKYCINHRAKNRCVAPELFIDWRNIMEGEYLKYKGDDDAQRRTVNQDRIQRVRGNSKKLQQLNDKKGHRRDKCKEACDIAHFINAGVWYGHDWEFGVAIES